MVFFPSAAFSNAPKFNETVVKMEYYDFLSRPFKQYPEGSFLQMTINNQESKEILNHTVMFFNYLNHEDTRQLLFDNYTTMSPVYISDTDAEYILFENNSFDSNVGLHGGAVLIDHQKKVNSSTSVNTEAPVVIFKNNNFTRNIAYFDGTAVYVGGGQGLEAELSKETRGLI